jgi:hypothetical protein
MPLGSLIIEVEYPKGFGLGRVEDWLRRTGRTFSAGCELSPKSSY